MEFESETQTDFLLDRPQSPLSLTSSAVGRSGSRPSPASSCSRADDLATASLSYQPRADGAEWRREASDESRDTSLCSRSRRPFHRLGARASSDAAIETHEPPRASMASKLRRRWEACTLARRASSSCERALASTVERSLTS